MNTSLSTLAWHHPSPPAIHHIEFLGEGDYCICYLVNHTHVLRLAKHAEASASIRREMLLLPLLEKHINVQIPHIQYAGTRVDTGDQFVFYPLVPGTILGPEILSSLEAACRTELVRQMARFVADLHSFPVETARSFGLKEIDPCLYLPDLMRRASLTIARHLDAAVWRYYNRLIEAYLNSPELHAYTPSLLHGDLSPGHFLADLSRCALTGVIDFGDCVIGDPYWDLMFILEDYSKETLELFLTFYSPGTEHQASTRVQMFQQLTNIDYCITKLAEGDPRGLEEALSTLVTQATSEAVL